MKKTKKIAAMAILAVFSMVFAAFAADKGNFSEKPRTNDGKKWRIAYYEGGEYIDYQKIFTETIRGLMKLGWIEYLDIPPQEGEQTAQLWKWLTKNMKSDYLELVPDGHYTANWDDKERNIIVDKIVNRLNVKNDVDLMIAMGTWAGKGLANDSHRTPVMVLSASDPISAGIIKSVHDSGFDHVHAQTDPFRYERQLKVFHEIIGFKKLGVAYEDTVNGRSYAALDIIEKISREKGFDIIKCHTKSDIADTGVAEKSVEKCFSELAKKSDAIYVTVQGGVNANSIPKLVKTANENKIPTFSQSGSEEVKQGFLLSISQAGFKYIGQFHAQTFAKVFNGAKPNDLDQLFQEPPKIAINLKTAEVVGFDPPIVLLGAADEKYRDMKTP